MKLLLLAENEISQGKTIDQDEMLKKFDNYFSIHFNLICSFTSYGMVNVLLK